MASPTISALPTQKYGQNYWTRICDPRTADFWLMSNGPWRTIYFTIFYVAIVFLGQKIMKSRKPLELRTPMFIYNVILVAINLFFLNESIVWTDYGWRLFDFQFPSPTDRSAKAMRMTTMFNYYFWTKFIDYFDTFFFVLRKKDNQITILHIYHHISVPFVGWLSCLISPTMPVLGLFAMLNCFCHVIMYSYYALSSFGPRIQPYLWWKRYITQIQLAQFVIIAAYGLLIQIFHNGYPLIYRLMPISQGIIFLIMFGNFYIQAYLNNTRKKFQ